MKRPKTYFAKPGEIISSWQVIDATDHVLGRLASRIARQLQGKDKPTYTPHVLTGDHVVVVNASQVRVTGRKLIQKMYYKHSGYTGNLRTFALKDMMEKNPEQVIKLAVKGMLPTTILGRQMLSRLKVYAGADHTHGSQTSATKTEER